MDLEEYRTEVWSIAELIGLVALFLVSWCSFVPSSKMGLTKVDADEPQSAFLPNASPRKCQSTHTLQQRLVAGILRSNELFRYLEDHVFHELLRDLRTLKYEKGAVIPGIINYSVCIVLQGAVNVLIQDQTGQRLQSGKPEWGTMKVVRREGLPPAHVDDVISFHQKGWDVNGLGGLLQRFTRRRHKPSPGRWTSVPVSRRRRCGACNRLNS